MYIKNKYIILIYRIVFILICGYGLYSNLLNSNMSNIFELLSYYTILSNIICLIYFLVLIYKMIMDWKNSKITYYPIVKGMITMGITVTFLVFHFILRSSSFTMLENDYLYSLPNILVHYIVPIMVLIDYLLFSKKGEINKKDPLKWLILPIIYWLLCLAKAFCGFTYSYSGSKYPYFFIDIDKYGLMIVIRNVFFLVVFFTVLGYLFYGFDKLLARLKGHN